MIALAGPLEAFWVGMAQHLWQTALFLGLLLPLAWTLRRTSARLLSLLYWIGVLKLALPLPVLGPAVAGLLPGGAGPLPAPVPADGWALTARFLYPAMPGGGANAGTGASNAVWVVLTAAWLAGAGLFWWRRWRSASPVRRLVRSGTPASGRGNLPALVSALGLPPGSVHVAQGFPVPFVWGAWRPRILLPETLVGELGPEDLRAVLLHEHEHVRRREPLRHAALALVLAAFWFYPLAWWLARRIRETAEMACDEAALRRGLPAADYCRSLARTLRLGLTPHVAAPAGVFGDRPSALRRRLERVRSGRRFPIMLSHRLGVGGALAAALLASLLPLAPAAAFRTADPQEGPLHELADADLPITLHVAGIPPLEALNLLARTAGLELHVEGSLSQAPIELELREATLAHALRRLAAIGSLRYEVLGPRDLAVRGVRRAGVDGITYPVLIEEFKALPEYPEEARQDRLEGTVILEAEILRDGSVGNLRPLRVEPEGYAPFVESAVDAVGRWQYEPALKEGEPVDVYFTVVINFQLAENGDDGS